MGGTSPSACDSRRIGSEFEVVRPASPQELQAATVIQRIHRGSIARKVVREKRDARVKTSKAASRIQSGYRRAKRRGMSVLDRMLPCSAEDNVEKLTAAFETNAILTQKFRASL